MGACVFQRNATQHLHFIVVYSTSTFPINFLHGTVVLFEYNRSPYFSNIQHEVIQLSWFSVLSNGCYPYQSLASWSIIKACPVRISLSCAQHTGHAPWDMDLIPTRVSHFVRHEISIVSKQFFSSRKWMLLPLYGFASCGVTFTNNISCYVMLSYVTSPHIISDHVIWYCIRPCTCALFSDALAQKYGGEKVYLVHFLITMTP